MNVFEFLGKPSDYRPKDKVVQLVKHWDEVPDSRKQFPYYGQVKKDGNFAMAVVTACGKVGIFGRTGSKLSSTIKLVKHIKDQQLKAGVYFGELMSKHKCSLEELSGVVNPERVNRLDEEQGKIASGLYIWFHDFITIQDLINGDCAYAYHVRHASLCKRLEGTELSQYILPYAVIHDEEAKDKFTQACIDADEEGAVYKKPDETWVAGHKGYRQMKEVRGVSYDLECVGYEEGKGKYAEKVANLIFRWKTGTIKAMLGKGWSHTAASMMFLGATGKSSKAINPVGKIFKVVALQESSKGKLRLPKVREVRNDKYTPDY